MNLKRYFDRVVLINLKRRPDRLARTRLILAQCRWPFRPPEIFEAIDWRSSPPPPHWRSTPGAWGCTLSHQLVLSQAVKDGVKRLLVLEDDVFFVDNFARKVRKFLSSVPSDWDQLMLGGQHRNHHGRPTLAAPHILRCTDCERTHCYAIRGPFMQKLSERWLGGGKYNGSQVCDWVMGRDPEMQFSHKVYAPEYFLAGQDRDGHSDIFGQAQLRRIWNPPEKDRCVVNLHAPARIAAALRQHGLCTGDGLYFDGDLGERLASLFSKYRNKPSLLIRLRRWILALQLELVAEPELTCTVWHPEATPDLVKKASFWPVYEVKARSLKSALKQLPPKLRALHQNRRTDKLLLGLRPLASRRRKPGATTRLTRRN